MSGRGCGIFLAAVLLLIGVLVAGGALVLWWARDDPFDDRTFTPAAWKGAKREDRARMSRDLIARYLTPGTTDLQVTALLGAPDSIQLATEKWPLPGVRRYSYGIGSWSFSGLDSAFVWIDFDGENRIVKAEINGY